jgi:hypothetical protein
MKGLGLMLVMSIVALAMLGAAEPAGPELTPEQLREDNANLRAKNAELWQANVKLKAEIADVRRANADLAYELAQARMNLGAEQKRAAMLPEQAPEPVLPGSQIGWLINPQKVGELGIGVFKAKISKVALGKGQNTGQSEDDLLQIYVTVLNHSDARLVDYRTWADLHTSIARHGFPFDTSVATLEDDLGNRYNRITFGLEKPADRVDQAGVYPGKAMTDVLVFELPVERAKELTLTLPLGHVELEGKLKFKISIASIPRN